MFNKIIIKRQFHISSRILSRRTIRKRNPGIGGQIAYVQDAVEAIKSDPEGFGDLEANFMDAHKSYRQHELEMHIQRDHIKHIMVKNKYFRDAQLPNMLTYSEKEHIRVLHNKDPEKWTVEHLAESFPGTTEIIQKIIKANWRPQSAERLRSHDVKVFQNWQRFKNGDFDEQLPPELKTHLLKFVERRLEDLQSLPDPAETFMPIQLPKPKSRDFQNLITSCSKYKDVKNQEETENENSKNIILNENHIMKSSKEMQQQEQQSTLTKVEAEEETYLLSKVHDKRRMRLTELKTLKLSEIMKPDFKSPNSKESSNTLEEISTKYFTNPSTYSHIEEFQFTEKFTSNEIVISVEDQKRYEMSIIKDRIHIPQKLWRKGATYRIDDCYYDDDGEFLYRVPGMTSTTIKIK